MFSLLLWCVDIQKIHSSSSFCVLVSVLLEMVVPWFQKLLKRPIQIFKILKSLDPPQDYEHHQQAEQQQPSEPLQEAIHVVPSEPKWVVSIRKKLEEARRIEERPCPWEKLSIYRVPRSLKDRADQKNYIPQVVSLGPYHHGKESLKEMEQHKWRALHNILKRHKQDVTIYLDAMKELEEKARACYEQPVLLSSEEFVQMMVLDGCFMVELFRCADEGGFESLGYAENDPVYSLRSTTIFIQRDMIMLENQIPLFVLDKLLSLQPGMSTDQKSVARLALGFFKLLMPTGPLASTHPPSNERALLTDPTSDESGLHCLDVFKRSLLKEFQPVHRDSNLDEYKILELLNYMIDERRQQLIPCVIDLKNAGVKFKKRETEQFWDIKFENGVLEIPRILVHDGTKSLFFNLIAFEQCHMDSTNDITSYAIFMDNLINSAEDVSQLHKRGIIEHWLGSDAEVAELFNGLCREVVFDNDDSSLSVLSKNINDYYKKRRHAWKAALRLKYFNTPWAVISFVAAVFLLLLTFAQTFYGVYAYYRPSS
ncbi:hypothetical protein Dimus_014211 [Dionaea muscipula]